MNRHSSATSKRPFKQEIIPQCLTAQCQECSGLYHSEVLQIEIRCNCKCHRHNAEQQQQVEKLVDAHSSVGRPEERQAVATTNSQQRKRGGNCSNG
jgi:acetyl-CoA carboxylase beta subunit